VDRPLVSVVTPVFNGERYLEQCIQSVVGQSYPAWEYLILDNRSTDGTGNLAARYAALDPRIRHVRESEFVDVYRNHNRALERIDPRARYVKFVHADDWLHPDCLELMVSTAEAHPTVGLVSAYRLIGNQLDGDQVFGAEETVLEGREVLRRAFIPGTTVTGSPTTVMYRVGALRDPARFFDETFWHADTDAANRVLQAWDCGFVHQVLSYTRLQPEALTARSYRLNSWLVNDKLHMLLRHGASVLQASELRPLIRRFLVRYAWFLAKQTVRPRRWRDVEYHRFHRQEIEAMLALRGTDAETRAVLRVLGVLLRHPRPS
jgi:glycosyltransferase involved in cell wall biosynthesis